MEPARSVGLSLPVRGIDGIHTGLRAEESSDGQCLRVIIDVTPESRKECVTISDGYRESKSSWQERFARPEAAWFTARSAARRRRRRDGVLGGAGRRVSGHTPGQRCWFHKMGNVLNALPTSQHTRAKQALQEIGMAATRSDALRAFDGFVTTSGTQYAKATGKLLKDKDSLLAFYDFPAEHGSHLRTTNPIESTFATVRHRTTRTRNCVSRATFLGLAFKLLEEAEKSWRRNNGAERIEPLLKGIPFVDGIAVSDNPPGQQSLAA